jgi:serine/threonine protein phosphatase 1
MHALSDRPLPSGFSLAADLRCYAVGDIHGRLDLLDRTNRKIESDLAARPCPRHVRIFLGDYVDRGPDSRGVIDRLIELERQTGCIFLKGNHETFIGEFIAKPTILPAWRSLGGLETLASYDVRPTLNPDPEQQQRLAEQLRAALPPAHMEFIRRLRPCCSFDGVFFAHAGVRPGVPLAAQQESDLIWIRDEFLLHKGRFEKMVVHGHTPVRTPEILPNRINIDTGAYVTGQLTCLWIEGDRMGFL